MAEVSINYLSGFTYDKCNGKAIAGTIADHLLLISRLYSTKGALQLQGKVPASAIFKKVFDPHGSGSFFIKHCAELKKDARCMTTRSIQDRCTTRACLRLKPFLTFMVFIHTLLVATGGEMKIFSEVYNEVGKALVNAGLGFILATLISWLFAKETLAWWTFPVGIIIGLALFFLGAWLIQSAQEIKKAEKLS